MKRLRSSASREQATTPTFEQIDVAARVGPWLGIEEMIEQIRHRKELCPTFEFK
jgi:hypothetical protein